MTIQAGEAHADSARPLDTSPPGPDTPDRSAPAATAAADDPADGTDPQLLSATRGGEQQGAAERIALGLFIAVPFAALVAAVPVAWGWGFGWTDLAIATVMYFLTCHGITVGYHRYFTHGAFKANRPVRLALAVAGSLAIEGPLVRWVADHRKHHRYSDKDGDPHSPWRYGETVPALLKGLWWAHMGWLFDEEQTPQLKYAPDLIDDPAIRRISRLFWLWTTLSMLLPPLVGGLVTLSWQGALSAFFWGSLVRVALLHHVTWSINSICHALGSRPFRSRDRSGNVWWLAVLSCGESWHNLHHADPTSARHGVLRGQIDSSARLIRWFELAGWVRDVRWPDAQRIAARRAA
ncbi:acyl-CoA desaturase [Kitasatospora purpeofusca]|uniref:acyl-CoA desaturase n=1 Tax=Kitasatospora purpeofusca TaxID=67352 RepID=UPI002258124A|nr:acyl-CoA desaturase [Kitasatospora purpeofusca]MCX4687420.1 acyl-CoA desaturase [Kitasatospora purpeofusca]